MSRRAHARLFCVALALWLTSAARSQERAPDNQIVGLQRRIDREEIRLSFEEPTGYLRSVLGALDVPISSQVLVFSKTSMMHEYISPHTPRAVYFNDRTYVALSIGAPVLEVATVDPREGVRFYELDQSRESPPHFRQESVCLTCHDPARTGIVRLIMRSHTVDRDGNALQSSTLPDLTLPLTDQTPFARRWGGWYVTGTHGPQHHMGNTRLRDGVAAIGTNVARAATTLDRDAFANLRDLTTLLDTEPYLSPHSDIVALMVLGHQTSVQNLIAAAGGVWRSGGDMVAASDALVRGLLFANAVPFTAAVTGTSSFAEDFSHRGRRDRQGRSLRDFDLERRLFRYPLSYLIYSDAFDALPPAVKDVVYRRLRDVLRGDDHTPMFSSLTASDRQAILDILRDTKPEFPQ